MARGTSASKPSVSCAKPNHTCIFYGDKLVLKLFRRLEPEVNPELAIGRFLTQKCDFPHTPQPWRRFWYEWVTASFTIGYLMAAKNAVFLPKECQELQVLLEAYGLEKTVHELGYEQQSRSLGGDSFTWQSAYHRAR